MSQTRIVGDQWPPLLVEGPMGDPFDLTGCRLTYDFWPDSRRAKARKDVSLRIIDRRAGKVYPPRPRTSGWAEVLLHYPDGSVERIGEGIRFERL